MAYVSLRNSLVQWILGSSSLSEDDDFELTLGLSASIDNELNKHPAGHQLELDVIANEMDQMQISQAEISLWAREIPEVDQSEISLRAKEIPLIDQFGTSVCRID